MHGRRDIDDAALPFVVLQGCFARSAGHECVEQQLGQQIDAQVVERPGQLDAIGAQPPRHEEGADVVHQHVEAGMAALEFLGQTGAPRPGPTGRPACSSTAGLPVSCRILGRDRLALVRIPPDSDDRRALPRQAQRGAKPIPDGRARHQADFARHAACWVVMDSLSSRAVCVVRDVARDVDAAAQFRVVDRTQRL